MKRSVARFFMAFGENPKDGATNVAAIFFGLGGLGGYLLTNNLCPPHYAPIIGVASVIGGGLTSWCVGKADDLGLR
jgi:hypothetical protein